MKSGKSLIELAEEITRRKEAKKDFIVNTEAVTMTLDGKEVVFGETAATVTPLAHRQLAEHVGIPQKYYDRMAQDDPNLLAMNVNNWLRKEPSKRMIRTLDGKARAFLSDRYRALENEDLAEAILPVLLDGEFDIMSSEITETRLYIKAVDRRVSRELAKSGAKFGDGGHTIVRVACPAITISNSEVGMGALSVLTGIYDGFCSNLATFGERSLRKTHVGGRHELVDDEMFALLTDETRRATDKAVWLQVKDVVKAAFDRVKFDELVDKIEGTQSQKIDDPVKVVELSSKRWGLNETEGKSILRHLIEGADLSRFGLHNAVTAASQELEDYDRATAFERIGGQIIELPANDWQEIAKAA